MAHKSSLSVVHTLGVVWAAALRDVLIAAINKGQFPFAVLGLVLLASIAKMPSEDVSRLLFRLVDGLERDSFLGYLISVLVLVGWYVHARYQRRMVDREIERIVAERDLLQSQSLGQHRVKSSKGRQ